MLSDKQKFPVASAQEVNPERETARKYVDRILGSDTFRASEVLRRLLRFLADKTFSGAGESLKEYSIGLDALGKPANFDPRQDAAVRLQASRLRQKLEEYYRLEGRHDALTIELPRGQYRIVWQPRVTDDPVETADFERSSDTAPAATLRDLRKWRILALVLGAVSLVLGFVSVLSLRASRLGAASPSVSRLAPELNDLWKPFIASAHHLIIAYTDPVFVSFMRRAYPDIFYRERAVAGWDEAVASPEVSVLRRSLGNPPVKPNYDFSMRSDLVSTFVLTQFFASRRGDISLTRLGELSWQQFADNDVVLLAPRFRIGEKQAALPVKLAFIAGRDGIRNVHPLAGEPTVFVDSPLSPKNDGETFALVSMMPGPLRRTKVISFTGNSSWAVIGGVESLTDPAFAREASEKLKDRSGEIPPFYQIVIRIGYRDGTPTNTSWVTYRALTLAQNSVSR